MKLPSVYLKMRVLGAVDTVEGRTRHERILNVAPLFHITGLIAHIAVGMLVPMPIVLGYLFATLGWLAGLGVFNDLGRLMLGKPLRAEQPSPPPADKASPQPAGSSETPPPAKK